jgi:hypothetical protein
LKLLIHGHPGSRLGFVAAVLQDTLMNNMFDVGRGQPVNYVKLHTFDQRFVSAFAGVKICINTTFDLLDRHFFLFFQKNVLGGSIGPAITKVFQNLHVTDRRILDKMFYSLNSDWLPDASATQHELYNYHINFEQTFDIEFMCNLYFQVNQTLPSSRLIEAIQTTNQINSPTVDQNHGCRVAAEILKFEHSNNFTEHARSWNLNQVCGFTDEGVCLDPDNLYKNVMSKLSLEYYQGPVVL